MNKVKQCVICGATNGCGMLVMGQFLCLDCQQLLDDPKRKVFGCVHNRRFSKTCAGKGLQLVKAKE